MRRARMRRTNSPGKILTGISTRPFRGGKYLKREGTLERGLRHSLLGWPPRAGEATALCDAPLIFTASKAITCSFSRCSILCSLDCALVETRTDMRYVFLGFVDWCLSSPCLIAHILFVAFWKRYFTLAAVLEKKKKKKSSFLSSFFSPMSLILFW